MTSINWKKWNRERFIEKIKCFFGFHYLVDEERVEIGTPDGMWRKAKYCQNCNRAGDTA